MFWNIVPRDSKRVRRHVVTKGSAGNALMIWTFNAQVELNACMHNYMYACTGRVVVQDSTMMFFLQLKRFYSVSQPHVVEKVTHRVAGKKFEDLNHLK